MSEDEMQTFGGAEAERERRSVRITEHVVATDGETLEAYGLGACVAVALYDGENGVGGLAHTVLPRREGSSAAPGKFADTGVRAMLEEMIEAGATYANVVAWLVGGADIFSMKDLPDGVGERTAEAAREALEAADVTIVDETIGDDYGRSVEFDTETGEVFVHTVGSDEPRRLPRPED